MYITNHLPLTHLLPFLITMSLLVDKHVDYVKDLFRNPSYLIHYLADHLKLNALYWGLGTLFILRHENEFPRDEVVRFVKSCIDPLSGGFGAAPKHDGHMLATLSALQVLHMHNAIDELTAEERNRIVSFITSNQLPDGSFQGDEFGEVDTRFVYNAMHALAILGELRPEIVDKAVDWTLKCQNFDGAFGMVPGAESHAAQTFTCIGVLAITGKLHLLPKRELLEWWLADRQVQSGGLNGRPEKLPDVCYSWWVLSSLAMLGKLHYVDLELVKQFVLSCQDSSKGGISDRAGKEVDVYHTFFGIAALSLLQYDSLVEIDPIYCMPKSATQRIKVYPYN